jgi:anthranilate/para-aminobenzoate synthase component I
MQMFHKMINELSVVKQQIYALAEQSDVFQICDSNEVAPALNIGKYELVAGLGLLEYLPNDAKAMASLTKKGKWYLGYLEYPETHNSEVRRAQFFVPRVVVTILRGETRLCLHNNGISDSEFAEWQVKLETHFSIPELINIPDFTFTPVTERTDYIRKVEQIKTDILYGRYYEMNYCIEFKAKLNARSFLPYMLRLNERTSAPFSAYARIGDVSILCSSPERFMTKKGNILVSQPIKGTNRIHSGRENDKQLEALKNSEKEKAENVMIVDLVRNDLAHVCEAGSIKVDELFGAYPFKTLNHLISTVSGQIKEGLNLGEVMEAMFPMGSMTGAPKLEVMKHIDAYEDHQRGIYSGCLGYIDPEGDFDFNVIIRTLVYHHSEEIISYKVGSAITIDSEADYEYEECLLKGHRLEDLFRA